MALRLLSSPSFTSHFTKPSPETDGQTWGQTGQAPPTSRPASQSFSHSGLDTGDHCIHYTQLLDPTSWHQLPGDSFALAQMHVKTRTLTHVLPPVDESMRMHLTLITLGATRQRLHYEDPSLASSVKTRRLRATRVWLCVSLLRFFNRSSKTYMRAVNKMTICDFQMSKVPSNSKLMGI